MRAVLSVFEDSCFCMLICCPSSSVGKFWDLDAVSQLKGFTTLATCFFRPSSRFSDPSLARGSSWLLRYFLWILVVRFFIETLSLT